MDFRSTNSEWSKFLLFCGVELQSENSVCLWLFSDDSLGAKWAVGSGWVHQGTSRTAAGTLDMSLLAAAMTWEGKTCDWSSKPGGQLFKRCVSAGGRALSHPPTSSPSHPTQPPLPHTPHRLPTRWKVLMESKSRDCVVLPGEIIDLLHTLGCQLLGTFSQSSNVQFKKNLGFLSCPQPHPPSHLPFPFLQEEASFCVRAKVTQFLWRATTGRHKSAHLTNGPQIYQAKGFQGLEATSWHAMRRGSPVTQALPCAWTSGWFYCSQPGNQTLQRPPAHITFHKRSYWGINHFGDLRKAQSENVEMGGSAVLCWPAESGETEGCVKQKSHSHNLMTSSWKATYADRWFNNSYYFLLD